MKYGVRQDQQGTKIIRRTGLGTTYEAAQQANFCTTSFSKPCLAAQAFRHSCCAVFHSAAAAVMSEYLSLDIQPLNKAAHNTHSCYVACFSNAWPMCRQSPTVMCRLCAQDNCSNLSKPSLARRCNASPCAAFFWETSPWSSCSNGQQTRLLACIDSANVSSAASVSPLLHQSTARLLSTLLRERTPPQCRAS